MQEEFLGEESLGEKYVGEKSVGEKLGGENRDRWDAGFRFALFRYMVVKLTHERIAKFFLPFLLV